MMLAKLDKTPRYNLNVVLRETGVKADTLRAWERRYQLPIPQRSEGGHRLFSQYDIETVKWLMERQEEGMSIGRAAALWHEIEAGGNDPLVPGGIGSIQQLSVVEIPDANRRLERMQADWIHACLSFDEEAAEQVLGEAFALFPMEKVCLDLLRPGLVEMGERWYTGEASVQQEHFASELAMRRMHALMAAAPKPIHAKTVILGCPPGEQHTFPLLFSAMMLRYRGWPIVYLGANVPIAQLEETVNLVKAGLVVQSATQLTTAAALLDSARALSGMGTRLAFGGRIFHQVSGLETRIPGHYLGESIAASIGSIERLLSESDKGYAPQVTLSDHSALMSSLAEKRHVIEAQVQQEIGNFYGAVIPDDRFAAASGYLLADVQAALKLGDMRLMEGNLLWLRGLIGNRVYEGEALLAFLASFRGAVKEYLGQDGQPLVEWLDSVIEGNLLRRNE